MAEDLSDYLKEQGLKVHYLHSDIETLKRSDILRELRTGTYDVVVGINLLREGLDLPEVSLVAILDADKEGFLRSKTSLIQTMGRAARHVRGTVIMYADTVTKSMKEAIDEVDRRRAVQEKYNKEHSITPTSISKPVRKNLVEEMKKDEFDPKFISDKEFLSMTPKEQAITLKKLERLMNHAGKNLDFEQAIAIRETIRHLKEL